jgi:hypothetical protein
MNAIPVQRNIVRYPTVAKLGDDTFAMQLDRSLAGGSRNVAQAGPFVGDVYTDIDVREGAFVYSVFYRRRSAGRCRQRGDEAPGSDDDGARSGMQDFRIRSANP